MHRGGLSESMATVTEIWTLEQLNDHVKRQCGFDDKDPDIMCDFVYQGFDSRIGWNTWMVR